MLCRHPKSLRIHRLRYRILIRIPLTKLVIVVFRLVSFFKVHVVVDEKVVVVLRSYSFVVYLFFGLFVRFEENCFVLFELVVVVFVVEKIRI